jgi:flagellar protein FlgJ
MNPLTDTLAATSLTAHRAEAIARGSEQTTVAGQESIATEFEGFFYSLLIKEMRQTLEHGLFGEEGSDTYGNLFDLYLGQHLGNSSKLGIAQFISDSIETKTPNTPPPQQS